MILVFAKSPQVGRVKTRLGNTLGMEKAAQIHIELLDRTLGLVSNAVVNVDLEASIRTTESTSLNATLYIEGDPSLPAMQELLLSHPLPIREQGDGDLGEKMFNAFDRELQFHPWVIIIGSDCPAMNIEYLQKAISALNTADVVIGPAEDGGYVLIGARRIDSRIFRGVEWGESRVLADTLDRLAQVGLTYELLPTLWDVDYPEDWQRWQELDEAKG